MSAKIDGQRAELRRLASRMRTAERRIDEMRAQRQELFRSLIDAGLSSPEIAADAGVTAAAVRLQMHKDRRRTG